jgi:hypothetical protein
MLFSWRHAETWEPLLTGVGRRRAVSCVLSVLQSVYTGARGFHGCRPRNLDSYYQNGIRVADFSALDAWAREIFLTDEFREITRAAVDTAIASISTVDQRVVHAILDDRVLIRYAGHYLVYGSERVCAIAAALSRTGFTDYRQVLKRFGRPTVFEVSLPWGAFTEHTLENLARHIRDNLSTVRRTGSPPEMDFTVTLRQTISPAQIISHYHPDVVTDPLAGMVEYKFNEAAA